VTLRIERPAGDDDARGLAERWQGDLRNELRELERRERRQIELLYRHDALEREEAPLSDDVMTGDLFSSATWRLLGLGQWELARAGALGGAAVGGTIDLLAGGGTFLAGTVLGGLAGGLASYLAVGSAARIEVVGRPLGGRVAIIGPLGDANFPWLLLDRALMHYDSICGRAHAVRAPLVIDDDARKQGASSALAGDVRGAIARPLARAAKSDGAGLDEIVAELGDVLEPVLAARLQLAPTP
jgi:hypothetical protein